MSVRRVLFGVSALSTLIAFVAPASAQGLLWSLPEDKTWVRFEGTMQQTEVRPDATAGNLPIEWIRHVTIKSVGQEQAEFEGKTVPCRWIELKVVTGKPSEMGIEAGPVGTQIVKILVPESRITGKAIYGDGIPASFVPIVKGFRKYGDGEVQPLTSKIFQIYPLMSPLMHYRSLNEEGEEDPGIPLGATTAKKYTGSLVVESFTTKADNTAEFYQADNVPFGLAKWKVKQTRLVKDRAESRDKFQPVSEVTLEMSATAQGNDAQTELEVPADNSAPAAN